MVLPEPDGEAPGDVPGVDVPGEAGLVVPGVALPEGCAVGVCTVPSEFTQGVVLPGAVVPGNVLGGFAGDPGCACELGGLEVDGLGVVPGVVPEPLLVGVQGGKLLGGFTPGAAEPGLVVVPCGLAPELGVVAPVEGAAVPAPGVAAPDPGFVVVPGVDGVPAGVLGLVCVFCVLEVPVVLGVPAAGGIPCDPVVLPAGGADAWASAQQAMASVVMSSVLLIANFVVISTPRLFCFTFEFMAASTRKNIRCSPELGLKPPRSESFLAARRKGLGEGKMPSHPSKPKTLAGDPGLATADGTLRLRSGQAAGATVRFSAVCKGFHGRSLHAGGALAPLRSARSSSAITSSLLATSSEGIDVCSSRSQTAIDGLNSFNLMLWS
jgi:hypothetical protein